MRREFKTANEFNEFTRSVGQGSFQITTEKNANGEMLYIVTDEHPENDPFNSVFDFSNFNN